MMYFFLQPYHKKKGAGSTHCYSEVSPNTFIHTTRKPTPYGASIHSLAADG